MERELTVLSKAAKQIAQVSDLNEIRDLMDKAEAIRKYTKAAGYALDVQNNATEIKLLAEKRAGELLATTMQHGGDRKSRSPNAILKLKDIGVNPGQSARWKKIASVPESTFREHIESTKASGRELTTASVLKLAKKLPTNGRAPHVPSPAPPDGCRIVESLDELSGESFSTIYADPPWAYSNKSTRSAADGEYETMTVDEICALPVCDLASNEAHLHLWTTSSFLREAFDVMEAWGFTYKSGFVWVKPELGIGNWWRLSHEYLLFGAAKNAKCPPSDKRQKSWIEHPRGEHSAKPEAVRLMIEEISQAPRLELFCRVPAEGWTVFGNQVEARLFPR